VPDILTFNSDGFLTPSDEQERLIKEYNLDDAYEVNTDPPKFLGFICRGCGIVYVSLEDRMLRRPDECHGCFLKAKFG
jgi:hypothetical protein